MVRKATPDAAPKPETRDDPHYVVLNDDGTLADPQPQIPVDNTVASFAVGEPIASIPNPARQAPADPAIAAFVAKARDTKLWYPIQPRVPGTGPSLRRQIRRAANAIGCAVRYQPGKPTADETEFKVRVTSRPPVTPGTAPDTVTDAPSPTPNA